MTFSPDKSPDRITPNKPLEPTEKPVVSQPPAGFESYMQGTGTANTAPTLPNPAAGTTPLDLARTAGSPTGTPSLASIQAQGRTIQDSLGTVGNQLNNPNLKLKRSQNHLVRQKLEDANSHLRAASSKLGVNAPPFQPTAGMNTLSRYIGMVGDGQMQMQLAQQELSKMAASGKEMQPGEMLSVQIKLGLAQQEIDYTSTLLSKVINSITQLLNTQL